MNTNRTSCDTCKRVLRWDDEGQEWLDETGSAMCSFFEFEDTHTVIEEPQMNDTVRHNDNRFALETPALTGEVVTEGHARYCRENGHAFNRKDGVEQGWCPRCGEDNGLRTIANATVDELIHEAADAEAIEFIGEVARAEEPLAQDFEVWIDDHHGDAAPLAADVAKVILVEAGIPVRGLATLTSFDGCYLVNVPQEWYDDLVESGDDVDATVTRNGVEFMVHAAMP